MKKSLKIFILTVFLVATSVSLVFADWVKVNDKYRYMNSATGQYVLNNWIQTGNGFYFLDGEGFTVKGWYLIDNKYYYFSDDGLMQTGFINYGNKKYYLNPDNGEMVTGWIQIYQDGKLTYMYFDTDGTMCSGWKKIGNDKTWYYFNNGVALVDTWAKINELWYHFGKTGVMDTGWLNDQGKMYHLDVKNGSLTKGWIQDQNGYEYYLSETDGSLVVNATVMIGGISYTFDETGRCVAKNQYSNSTRDNLSNFFTNGSNGIQSVYGINVGISPGTGVIAGQESSSGNHVNSLEPGSTEGPK